MTEAPLTPPPTGSYDGNFRPAFTEYLPTPPASHSHGSENREEIRENAIDKLQDLRESSPISLRFAPSEYGRSPTGDQPSYRRRFGRGGRLIIDRRGLRVQNKEELDRASLDRWKFDQDDDDMDEPTIVDPFDITDMRYRAAISGSSAPHPQTQTMKRHQLELSGGLAQTGVNPSVSSGATKEATAGA